MADQDDEKYRQLNSQKAQNEADQASTQREIDAINDKIDRLRAAYNKIDGEKESVKNERYYLNCMEDMYSGSWKGEHATNIYTACSKGGELYGDYTAYIDKVDAIEDEINDEIRRLKDQLAERHEILGGLIKAWNYISTEIRNFFN